MADKAKVTIVSRNSHNEVNEVLVDGLKSDEQVVTFMKNMERVSHRMKNGMYPVVMINDEKCVLSTKFYNDEERKALNSYYKEHRSGGSGSTATTALSPEELQTLKDTYKWLKANKAPEEMCKGALSLIFKDPNMKKAQEGLAGLGWSVEQIASALGL